MSYKELNVLVGTALTDKDFKESLLKKPLSVTPRFNLTEGERELVVQAAGHACSLSTDPLTGFARFIANSEIVRKDPTTIILDLNLELFPDPFF